MFFLAADADPLKAFHAMPIERMAFSKIRVWVILRIRGAKNIPIGMFLPVQPRKTTITASSSQLRKGQARAMARQMDGRFKTGHDEMSASYWPPG